MALVLLQDARKQLGINERTIRRWVSRGLVSSEKKDGRVWVDFDELKRHFDENGHRPRRPKSVDQEVEALLACIASLESLEQRDQQRRVATYLNDRFG